MAKLDGATADVGLSLVNNICQVLSDSDPSVRGLYKAQIFLETLHYVLCELQETKATKFCTRHAENLFYEVEALQFLTGAKCEKNHVSLVVSKALDYNKQRKTTLRTYWQAWSDGKLN